jgi:hypothetical protein
VRATGYPQDETNVIGWAPSIEGAESMAAAIRTAPGCISTEIFDRQEGKSVITRFAGMWQPIESVPRDARNVWIGTKTRVALGYYSNRGEPTIGWHSSDDDMRLSWEPTHWQPYVIPAPPEK